MCSKKWAVPFVLSVSAREPASIQTPTVAVWACGWDSVATVRPFGRVVVSVMGAGMFAAVANDRKGRWALHQISMSATRAMNSPVDELRYEGHDSATRTTFSRPFGKKRRVSRPTCPPSPKPRVFSASRRSPLFHLRNSHVIGHCVLLRQQFRVECLDSPDKRAEGTLSSSIDIPQLRVCVV